MTAATARSQGNSGWSSRTDLTRSSRSAGSAAEAASCLQPRPDLAQRLCGEPLLDHAPRVALQGAAIGHHLADAVLGQLALEEADEHVGRHGVELDAPPPAGTRSPPRWRRAPRGSPPASPSLPGVSTGSDCRPIASTSASRKPRSTIRQLVLEPVAAAVAAQRAEDREAAHVEVVQHQHLAPIRGASPLQQRRAAVVDMPLVDMTATSNRSAMRAAWSSGSKPSFSMNSTVA